MHPNASMHTYAQVCHRLCTTPYLPVAHRLAIWTSGPSVGQGVEDADMLEMLVPWECVWSSASGLGVEDADNLDLSVPLESVRSPTSGCFVGAEVVILKASGKSIHEKSIHVNRFCFQGALFNKNWFWLFNLSFLLLSLTLQFRSVHRIPQMAGLDLFYMFNSMIFSWI